MNDREKAPNKAQIYLMEVGLPDKCIGTIKKTKKGAIIVDPKSVYLSDLMEYWLKKNTRPTETEEQKWDKVVKTKILKCLTEDFKNNQAIFDKDQGWQVFNGTDLTMVMGAVVKGIHFAKLEINPKT